MLSIRDNGLRNDARTGWTWRSILMAARSGGRRGQGGHGTCARCCLRHHSESRGNAYNIERKDCGKDVSWCLRARSRGKGGTVRQSEVVFFDGDTRIIIVDDEDLSASSSRAAFDDAGYQVIPFRAARGCGDGGFEVHRHRFSRLSDAGLKGDSVFGMVKKVSPLDRYRLITGWMNPRNNRLLFQGLA